MEELGQYVLSVVAMAVLCRITELLFSGSNAASGVKLVTGLMITLTVVAPLLNGERFSLDLYMDEIAANGQWAVSDGEDAARISASEIISGKTQAYILDKAAGMGAEVTAFVELGEAFPPMPVQVTIRGSVSPYVKQQLMLCIAQDLGIPKEKQIWIS